MKWNFKDPTAGLEDQVPFTPEERKAIHRAGALMIVIFIVAVLIIFVML